MRVASSSRFSASGDSLISAALAFWTIWSGRLAPARTLVTARNGYLYANDQPGHGVSLDEALAAKFPCKASVIEWTQARLPDGTLSPP